jgi:hypothetical protein
LVDGADFLAWQRRFGGIAVESTNAAAPEPASLLLSLIALVGLIRVTLESRRRKPKSTISATAAPDPVVILSRRCRRECAKEKE